MQSAAEQPDAVEPDASFARALAVRWRGALFAFVLAALTGALFRASTAWGVQSWLTLTNVRHAHSHLMFFGWVTPALMTLLTASLPRVTRAPGSPGLLRASAVTLALGFASYPAFLLFGYSPVAVGAARVPPAVLVAGLNMLAWYGFAVGYARATWGLRRTPALLAWDLAFLVLLASTLGAWALPLLRPLGLDPDRWRLVLVHAFLDAFAEGWLPLAVLGLFHARWPRPIGGSRRWALVAIAAAAPFAFGVGAPLGLVPPTLRSMSGVASLVWSLGMLAQLALFAREAPSLRLRLPLAFGASAACARALSALWPSIDWAAQDGLRLLYLHALLVGLVSLALFAVARDVLGAFAPRWPLVIEGALASLVASLVPFTPLWPDASRGDASALAFFAALGAALAGIASAGPAVRPTARSRA